MSAVKLILASNNASKLRELRELLKDMDMEILSQRDAGCGFEVDETGTTFEENAFLKASAVQRASGCAAVADDSGLMVRALKGAPGVYSARYTGSHDATDAERCGYLLNKLRGVQDRSAKFVSCLCCVFPNGDMIKARGECKGMILESPRGENGFGYDPIFLPDGFELSMAQLTQQEKNIISHRGKAIRLFKEELRKYYAHK